MTKTMSSTGSSNVLTPSSTSSSVASSTGNGQTNVAGPLAEIKHNWLIKNVQHCRDGDEYTSELFPSSNCSTR